MTPASCPLTSPRTMQHTPHTCTQIENNSLKIFLRPIMVAQACNLRLWKDEAWMEREGQLRERKHICTFTQTFILKIN